MITTIEKIEEVCQFLVSQSCDVPESGLILGPGLGEFAGEIENVAVVPHEKTPSRGKSTVAGHAEQLIYDDLGGHKVIVFQGCFHSYEGNPMELVTSPVRVMKALGCKGPIVTNVAGGIDLGSGTLMVILDHINMTGQNPLIGMNLDDFGPRSPDMSDVYMAEYHDTAHKVAEKIGIKLDEGVYLGVPGPCYEAPAEIRAFQTPGADTIGMSIVPEVIVAARSGLKVSGISAITNHVAGFQSSLSHEEVVVVT